MYILVIEDNIRILDNITYILEQENFRVDKVDNGEDGINKALTNNYDLIVLDIMLPEMDGFEVLESLQLNKRDIPVIVLSAKSQTEDKVKALNLGCYDYLTKPFASEELLARIRGILRRKFNVINTTIKIDELIIDTNTKNVFINDTKIELTQKEYELLEFLSYNKDKVVSRVAIGEHIWGESMDYISMSNFIDVHIKNIRKKIETVTEKKYIHTKRGMGFMVSSRIIDENKD